MHVAGTLLADQKSAIGIFAREVQEINARENGEETAEEG